MTSIDRQNLLRNIISRMFTSPSVPEGGQDSSILNMQDSNMPSISYLRDQLNTIRPKTNSVQNNGTGSGVSQTQSPPQIPTNQPVQGTSEMNGTGGGVNLLSYSVDKLIGDIKGWSERYNNNQQNIAEFKNLIEGTLNSDHVNGFNERIKELEKESKDLLLKIKLGILELIRMQETHGMYYSHMLSDADQQALYAEKAKNDSKIAEAMVITLTGGVSLSEFSNRLRSEWNRVHMVNGGYVTGPNASYEYLKNSILDGSLKMLIEQDFSRKPTRDQNTSNEDANPLDNLKPSITAFQYEERDKVHTSQMHLKIEDPMKDLNKIIENEKARQQAQGITKNDDRSKWSVIRFITNDPRWIDTIFDGKGVNPTLKAQSYFKPMIEFYNLFDPGNEALNNLLKDDGLTTGGMTQDNFVPKMMKFFEEETKGIITDVINNWDIYKEGGMDAQKLAMYKGKLDLMRQFFLDPYTRNHSVVGNVGFPFDSLMSSMDKLTAVVEKLEKDGSLDPEDTNADTQKTADRESLVKKYSILSKDDPLYDATLQYVNDINDADSQGGTPEVIATRKYIARLKYELARNEKTDPSYDTRGLKYTISEYEKGLELLTIDGIEKEFKARPRKTLRNFLSPDTIALESNVANSYYTLEHNKARTRDYARAREEYKKYQEDLKKEEEHINLVKLAKQRYPDFSQLHARVAEPTYHGDLSPDLFKQYGSWIEQESNSIDVSTDEGKLKAQKLKNIANTLNNTKEGDYGKSIDALREYAGLMGVSNSRGLLMALWALDMVDALEKE